MGSQFVLKDIHSIQYTGQRTFCSDGLYRRFSMPHAWSSLHLRNSVVPDTSNNGETDLDNGIRNKK